MEDGHSRVAMRRLGKAAAAHSDGTVSEDSLELEDGDDDCRSGFRLEASFPLLQCCRLCLEYYAGRHSPHCVMAASVFFTFRVVWLFLAAAYAYQKQDMQGVHPALGNASPQASEVSWQTRKASAHIVDSHIRGYRCRCSLENKLCNSSK